MPCLLNIYISDRFVFQQHVAPGELPNDNFLEFQLLSIRVV